ncbi:MAG: hypothetical protein AMXMBFR53_42020 [Gemmatimonadota bacterium]
MEREAHPAGMVIRELRRRRVGRVALGYLAVGYALVEAAHAFLPAAAPSWAFRAVLGSAALGFPVALVLAWDFDITDWGIVRTLEEEGSQAPLPARPRLPWLSFVAFWVLAGLAVRLFA